MPAPVIEQIAVGPMQNLAYIVGDADAGVCAVVDPGWDSKSIIDAAAKAGLKIEMVLLTHAHFDHTGALGDMVSASGAKVYVHSAEATEADADISFVATADGEEIELGSLRIRCIHTPGHTPGSQCFLVNGNLFTGDTLFVDGCGRVDLPGSDPKAMLESLGRLSKMDPKLVVWPGHDYGGRSATLAKLIDTNPYLGAVDESKPL